MMGRCGFCPRNPRPSCRHIFLEVLTDYPRARPRACLAHEDPNSPPHERMYIMVGFVPFNAFQGQPVSIQLESWQTYS